MGFARNLIIYATLLVLTGSKAFSYSSVKNHKKFYVGLEGGLSLPLAKGIKDEETKTEMLLKRSPLYTGRIGYEFAPGMYLELSASIQPKFKTAIKIPDVGSGLTSSSAKIFTINVVYDFAEFHGIQPYFIAGAGFAAIKVKKGTVNYGPLVVFETAGNTSRSLAWQVGLGATKEVNEVFKLDASVKVQIAHNVKLKYQTLNLTTGAREKGHLKKTLGVAEFAIGGVIKL